MGGVQETETCANFRGVNTPAAADSKLLCLELSALTNPQGQAAAPLGFTQTSKISSGKAGTLESEFLRSSPGDPSTRSNSRASAVSLFQSIFEVSV